MRIFKILFILCLPLILLSCGVKKAGVMEKRDPASEADSLFEVDEDFKEAVENLPEDIAREEEIPEPILRIDTAKGFLGAPYRYGGNTHNGMDCSGLIQIAFLEDQIRLPRSSRDMAQRGIEIKLEEVSTGDLLFFTTSSRHNSINHVGLVTESTENGIFFIHSTTSRGVIISSLEETFWKNSLVMARRIN